MDKALMSKHSEDKHGGGGNAPKAPPANPWILRLALPIATGLGSGYLPIPGTAGTFAIFVPHALFFPLLFTARYWWLGLAVIVATSLIGTWASTHAERYFGRKDDGHVVIDEWAGYMVTIYLLPNNWLWFLAGFFVFRFFDVIKPPPADGLQKLGGGLGIMIDDLVAGAFGFVLLHGIRLILLGLGFQA